MDLVLYKDVELTQPFSIEDIGDVDAGDIKFVEGYLKNESDRDIVKIEPEILDDIRPKLTGEAAIVANNKCLAQYNIDLDQTKFDLCIDKAISPVILAITEAGKTASNTSDCLLPIFFIKNSINYCKSGTYLNKKDECLFFLEKIFKTFAKEYKTPINDFYFKHF